MASGKEYAKLWVSYEAYFEALGDAEVGRLARAMIDYKSHGVEPKFCGNERFIWPAIKRDIDEANQAQETAASAHREAGRSGGRPRNQKNQNGFEETILAQGQGQGQGQGHSQEDTPQPPQTGGGGSAFEKFWAAYPKKVGKQDAKRKFEKAKTLVPLETMLTAIERQRQSDQWKRGYIPNPATWLNQGRWEDELPEGGVEHGEPSGGAGKSANKQWGVKTRQLE